MLRDGRADLQFEGCLAAIVLQNGEHVRLAAKGSFFFFFRKEGAAGLACQEQHYPLARIYNFLFHVPRVRTEQSAAP